MFNIIETFKDDSPNFNELVTEFITFKDDSPNFNELVTEFIKSMVNRD